MKIVVGLGNPGDQYTNTRHNAGVMLVNKMSENLESDYGWRRKKEIIVYEAKNVVLVKSAGVFMNESGRIIQELKYMNYEFDNFYLAHDDLDLRLGECKIHLSRGPKDHHGIQSVEAAMGTNGFWRIRIGIDNRQTPVQGDKYVLQMFSLEERKVLDEIMEKVIKELAF